MSPKSRARLRTWRIRLTELHRRIIWMTRNRLRARYRDLDYIVLPLQGTYPEIPPPPAIKPLPYPLNRLIPTLFPFLFPRELSLLGLEWILQAIGGDRRVAGVIFPFGTLRANLAALYSIRRMFSRIQANFEALGEYKTTPNMFCANTMTDPHREMLHAILDSMFDELVTTIAEGRGLTLQRVRELIDEMPILAQDAVAVGLVDGVGYQDELPERLRRRRSNPTSASSPLPWLTWQEARRKVFLPPRRSPIPAIGLVPIEGMIVSGWSRQRPIPFPVPPPLAPLFNVQTGAETVIQALRNAATRTEIAAVILYVDSPGGSALASDLIWREVYRLRERKPVVALMGAQAASGGYYVAAPAHRIIARPTTLTGSIGIWGGKICLRDLYDRLAVGRGVVQRGAMAGLYSELAPFTDAERVRMRRQIAAGYTRFKERVAVGRGMDLDQVEAVARGRVWTGAQAQDIGLVDELGDMETALQVARSLAHLDPAREYMLHVMGPARHWLLPLSTSAEEIDGSLLLLWEAWRRCSSGRQWPRGDTFQNLISLPDMAGERIWALAPWVSILS